MTDLDRLEDMTIGQYIHNLEQNIEALETKNASMLAVLREARQTLVESRDAMTAMARDNARMEAELFTAAWYGSVHGMGVRYKTDVEEAL